MCPIQDLNLRQLHLALLVTDANCCATRPTLRTWPAWLRAKSVMERPKKANMTCMVSNNKRSDKEWQWSQKFRTVPHTEHCTFLQALWSTLDKRSQKDNWAYCQCSSTSDCLMARKSATEDVKAMTVATVTVTVLSKKQMSRSYACEGVLKIEQHHIL